MSYKIRNILDVGCSSGDYTFFLTKKYPWPEIDAIDQNRDSIKNAVEIKRKKRYLKTNFTCSNFQESNLKNKYDFVFCVETLSKNKISIKVLTRVDIVSKKNTELALSMNKRLGWDVFSVRHCQHPLRAVIVDDQFFNIKEVLSPIFHKELKKKTFIFYVVKDPEWINWLQKVFWHLWNQSIDAELRLKALDSVRKLVK